jgi:hypothetical protein
MPLTIETNYTHDILTKAAARCLRHRTGNWWETSMLPCGDTFREAEQFTSKADNVDAMSPEHAACFLLLVGEALR